MRRFVLALAMAVLVTAMAVAPAMAHSAPILCDETTPGNICYDFEHTSPTPLPITFPRS